MLSTSSKKIRLFDRLTWSFHLSRLYRRSGRFSSTNTQHTGSLNQRTSTINTIWRDLSEHFLLGKVPSPLIQITSREGLVQTVGETCRGSLLKNSRYRMWRQLSREHSIPLSCVKRLYIYIYILYICDTYIQSVYRVICAIMLILSSCRLCYR